MDTQGIADTFDEKLNLQSQPTKNNALSDKITNVLSQSYADAEIRDAIHYLDDRDIRNTAETRRNLRLDVQRDVLRRNREIIKDFGVVAEQLKRIGKTIQSLNTCCDDIRRHVVAARQENAPLLDEASTILEQRQEVQAKQQLLDAFTKHFILSEGELSVLTSATSAVDESFFAVMKRLRQIHADCQILLGSENQRLGLELMEETSRNLNSGYQKLFRWVQREFQGLNLENPQISSVIRKALRTLAERPTLFQSCLDYFSEARERILTDTFYAALTGSAGENEDGLTTKPIEFNSHDPLRYVGDMLAWTHSTTVSEKEALEILFVEESDEIKRKLDAGREAEPWNADESKQFDGAKALDDLVNRNTAGVARGLRQRVEQVLQNHDNALLLYRIANLIVFYMSTYKKLLGPTSSILTTLIETRESALKHFRDAVSETVTSTQAEIKIRPTDLALPDYLDEALGRFQALLKNYDSSLVSPNEREADFESVITIALDPFLTTSEKHSRLLSDPEREIFLLNCLLAAKITLTPFDFTTSRLKALDGQIQTLTTHLTEYQHAFFLHTSGLHPLLAALSPFPSPPPDEKVEEIAALPSLQPQSLTAASTTLDEFLPSALMDAQENLQGLADRRVMNKVTAEAADRFCTDFEVVEQVVAEIDRIRFGDDEEDEDEEEVNGDGVDGLDGKGKVRLRDLFPRTSGEIRVLLS